MWHSGLLYFVDNASYKGKLYWSIFDLVQELKGITFKEALQEILKTSGKAIINNYKSASRTPKLNIQIRFTYKSFPEDNLFLLDNAVLNKELIYLVQDYWIQEKGVWHKNKYHNPHEVLTIAYYFPETDSVKLYWPYTNSLRWYSNCQRKDIFGWHKIYDYKLITDTLVITKSQKDRIFLDYHLGIPAIALQNEGSYINEDQYQAIDKMFDRKIFLYDNDLTGIEQSQKLSSKYNWENITLECNYKDVYEFYSNDKEGCKTYLKNIMK